MSEWFDSQKQSISRISKLLQERIEKANPRRELTAEETKHFAKLEAIAECGYCADHVFTGGGDVARGRLDLAR